MALQDGGLRDVLVIGDINLDVMVRAEGPIEHGTDVLADIVLRPGGAGANVAVGLARLGLSTTLVGCVGRSERGALVAQLQAAGVTLALRPVPDVSTGTIVVIVDPSGERSMASDRGANLALAADDITDDLIRSHRHLHLSGYTLLDPGPRSAGLKAIGRAFLGRTVSVDPASVAPLRDYGVARFRADIAGIDVLLPNSDEARVLSGVVHVEEAARVLARSHPVVAVTCGADGAVWADRTGVLAQPTATEAESVLDTTGAGDAFTAGLLAAWLAGRGPADCLTAGQRACADVISHWGAQ